LGAGQLADARALAGLQPAALRQVLLLEHRGELAPLDHGERVARREFGAEDVGQHAAHAALQRHRAALVLTLEHRKHRFRRLRSEARCGTHRQYAAQDEQPRIHLRSTTRHLRCRCYLTAHRRTHYGTSAQDTVPETWQISTSMASSAKSLRKITSPFT